MWSERVVYSVLWGLASAASAFLIYANGEDYVDKPIFPME